MSTEESQLTRPASNILFLPFRRTHTASLSSAIKQYISSKYDQHPDMFARDLDLIDKIRAEAVNCLEAHTSGIRKLTAYAAQLVWIGGKFPIDVSAYPSPDFLGCMTRSTADGQYPSRWEWISLGIPLWGLIHRDLVWPLKAIILCFAV